MNKQILTLIVIIFTFTSFQSIAINEIKAAPNKATANILVIDINNAEPKDLVTLKGVGMKKAQAIVTYRQTNGPFANIEDLLKVQGIGKHVLAENKSRLKL
ncbi:helix-hairpin-helix domain-containing protein [Colwellia sp. 1_MG-2023]|uniref:ComEA family DNA-binding protein n=1 Tax=Colwellia sp. 1_MG-2023 TaxID=3062649 RepID=UPI0026E1A8E3|nr:helix-hairpin-helix domain-containing protein [Colwellia sp. 1_MG-2023]MDO6446868.1 helix-hairpin-helix domain-containing protein [Colwellia sp. 1_MG-2023]